MIEKQAVIGDTAFDNELNSKIYAITQCEHGDCIYWCEDGSDWHHYLFEEKSILRVSDSVRVRAAKRLSWTDGYWQYPRLYKLAILLGYIG
jgi:hypothetical protein